MDGLETLLGEDRVLTAEVVRASGGRAAIQRARRHGAAARLWRGTDLTTRVAADPRGVLSAALTVSPHAVLTGPGALRAARFDVPAEWPQEVTVPPPGLRCRPGLRVRTGVIPGGDVVELATGLRLTVPARSVADALRLEEPYAALWVLDQALARGLPDVAAFLQRGSRGVRRAHELLALGDGARESPLEARVRLVLARHGVPPPSVQHAVPEARARLDLAWPDRRVALEADGAGWHGSPEAVHRDRRRQNALVGLGWRVLRCTWYDAVREPAALAATVRAALA